METEPESPQGSLLAMLDELEARFGPALDDNLSDGADSCLELPKPRQGPPEQQQQAATAPQHADQNASLALLLHLGSAFAPVLGVPWPEALRPSFRLPPLVPLATKPAPADCGAAAAGVPHYGELPSAAAPQTFEDVHAGGQVQQGPQSGGLLAAFHGGGGSSCLPARSGDGVGSGASSGGRRRRAQETLDEPELARLRRRNNQYVQKCRAKQRAKKAEERAVLREMEAELEWLKLSKKGAEEEAAMHVHLLQYQELMMAALVAARKADAGARPARGLALTQVEPKAVASSTSTSSATVAAGSGGLAVAGSLGCASVAAAVAATAADPALGSSSGAPPTGAALWDSPPEVHPELLSILSEHDIFDQFRTDILLRYPVAGYSQHIGLDGRVREAPPITKVFEDYAQIVKDTKLLLEQALQQGQTMVQELGESAAFSQENVQLVATGLDITTLELQLQQQGSCSLSGGSTSSGSGSTFRQGSFPYPAAAPEDAGQAGRGHGRGCGEGAAACSAMEDGSRRWARGGDGGGHAQDLAQGSQPPQWDCNVGQAITVADTVVASLAPTAAGGAFCLGHAREALLRHVLTVAALRGSQPWALVPGGIAIRAREGTYVFTGDQLACMLALQHRTGVLLWQQSLFFPRNAIKVASMRIDNQEPPNPEDMAIERWEHVLDELQLQPSQLRELATLYEQCLLKLQPSSRQREAAVEKFKQLQQRAVSMGVGLAQWQQAKDSLEWATVTSELEQVAQTEFNAHVSLGAGTFRVMQFPLQKAKIILHSWPLAPQVDLLAMAAVKRMGQAS